MILAQELLAADEAVAAALERPPGAPVVLIHRVRTADDDPIAVEWVHLPTEDFPRLERARSTTARCTDCCASDTASPSAPRASA